ncbi:putrescine transporter ATP-binding subunit [Striga asiatica]|uniref:Putrescine transporter ATP-binding subunit n=1 Tax=Striga asiatica TaxID=4170 RepID=A0A5A7QFV1_STRAF|nr:putrescine transporter ATP-binding subunit [Striga asiatica]
MDSQQIGVLQSKEIQMQCNNIDELVGPFTVDVPLQLLHEIPMPTLPAPQKAMIVVGPPRDGLTTATGTIGVVDGNPNQELKKPRTWKRTATKTGRLKRKQSKSEETSSIKEKKRVSSEKGIILYLTIEC